MRGQEKVRKNRTSWGDGRVSRPRWYNQQQADHYCGRYPIHRGDPHQSSDSELLPPVFRCREPLARYQHHEAADDEEYVHAYLAEMPNIYGRAQPSLCVERGVRGHDQYRGDKTERLYTLKFHDQMLTPTQNRANSAAWVLVRK